MQRSLVFGLIGCFCLLFPGPSHAGGTSIVSQHAEMIQIERSKGVQEEYRGHPDQALEHYKQALRIAADTYGDDAPYLAEIYYDMGSLCLNSSKFNLSEEYLGKAVKLNPNSSAAHLRLAELMRIRGRSQDAQKHALLVVAKHRDDAVARQELAIAYEQNEPPDNNRAYREYAALEQLVRHEKEVLEGKQQSAFLIPGFSLPSFAPAKPAGESAPPPASEDESAKKKADADKKKDDEARKKADADKAKAEQAKKKADLDKAKAEQAKKKAESDKAKSELAARKKAELEAKKKADAEKRKKEQSVQIPKNSIPKNKAPQPAKPESGEPEESAVFAGKPANLRGKAELLTPISGKKASVVESSSSEEAPVAKVIKPVKRELKPMEAKAEPVAMPPKPKAGKHAPGLVPPPPPVIPTFPVMNMAPPPPPVKAQSKPAPKKEEKPKEEKSKPETGKSEAASSEEDDFLLDWGDAKNKKKK